jgi:hypothetical protein
MPLECAAVEPVGNLNRDIQQFLEFHGPTGDVVLQRLTFQILHCDECLSVFFTDVVNGADVVVIQRGSGLCFPLESSEHLWVFGHIIRKEFQRYEAM